MIITEYDMPRKEAMPHDVIVDAEGKAWYSDFGHQFVGVLDPKTGAVKDIPIPVFKAEQPKGGLDLQFDGEALSRAAITRLEKVITAVELRSGIPRASVGGFATHQPNPRLLTLLAKQCGVSADTFPPVCRTSGNLGTSMCGAALHAALQEEWKRGAGQRKPIFLASLGPGLLFGGSWLTPGAKGRPAKIRN